MGWPCSSEQCCFLCSSAQHHHHHHHRHKQTHESTRLASCSLSPSSSHNRFSLWSWRESALVSFLVAAGWNGLNPGSSCWRRDQVIDLLGGAHLHTCCVVSRRVPASAAHDTQTHNHRQARIPDPRDLGLGCRRLNCLTQAIHCAQPALVADEPVASAQTPRAYMETGDNWRPSWSELLRRVGWAAAGAKPEPPQHDRPATGTRSPARVYI